MPDSLHEIPIQAAPMKVYEAWTTHEGLCSWWTADSVVPNEVGRENLFSFDRGSVTFHFRIDEQVPRERVLWTGVVGDRMPEEWVGTKIDVRISSFEDGRTRLRFAHAGWKSAEGYFAMCTTTWGELMYRLRDYCEGKGRGPLFK